MALPAALVLSGLSREHFSEDLQEIYNHGSVLLKSPSSSSLASSSTTSSYHSLESGISSMSNESTAKSLDHYIEVISQLAQGCLHDVGEIPLARRQLAFLGERKILYQGRDLLDLVTNIKSGWAFQAATLPRGVDNFLDNRSQYYRVNGGSPPPHIMLDCTHADCEFREPHYY